MAQVPIGSRLIENPVSKAPGFWLENVLVMAGVPNIFAAQVDSALPFLQGGTPTATGTIVAHVGESLIADLMSKTEAQFQDMTIGSYPYFRSGESSTSIVVRSANVGHIDQALEALGQALTTLNYAYEQQGIRIPQSL